MSEHLRFLFFLWAENHGGRLTFFDFCGMPLKWRQICAIIQLPSPLDGGYR